MLNKTFNILSLTQYQQLTFNICVCPYIFRSILSPGTNMRSPMKKFNTKASSPSTITPQPSVYNSARNANLHFHLILPQMKIYHLS